MQYCYVINSYIFKWSSEFFKYFLVNSFSIFPDYSACKIFSMKNNEIKILG